tara:strand:+ start:378 stop:593 length:216 start_codon:yes stop_codon:yes gene_type:complete
MSMPTDKFTSCHVRQDPLKRTLPNIPTKWTILNDIESIIEREGLTRKGNDIFYGEEYVGTIETREEYLKRK